MAGKNGETGTGPGSFVLPVEPVLGDSIDPASIGGAGAAPGAGTGAGSGDSGDGFDPAIHIARDRLNGDGSFTKRKRRRGGGGTGSASAPKTAADLKTSVDGLANVLFIVHGTIAEATKAPEMALSSEESTMLASATTNVLQHYDFVPDPKTQAILGLLGAAGMIYGPRIYLIRDRLAKEKQEKAAATVSIASPGGASIPA